MFFAQSIIYGAHVITLQNVSNGQKVVPKLHFNLNILIPFYSGFNGSSSSIQADSDESDDETMVLKAKEKDAECSNSTPESRG